jgi:DDE superfamily endonuclease
MHSKNEVEFQGQIETVLKQSLADLDIKVIKIFQKLHIQSHLTAAGIRKHCGYTAFELMYAMVNMCFMHIHGVADFVKRNLTVICAAQKDAFYRLKKRDCGWRSFHWRLVRHMGKLLHWSQHRRHEAHFILDTTCLPKRGQKIEEVSWIYDHNQGKAVLGYEVLTLGIVKPQGFYPLDFGCHFSRKKGKHYRPAQATGSTARRVKEAGLSKLELSLQMLQRALTKGVQASYVLFDRWFTSPKFLQEIRSLGLHAIGRLKNDAVRYSYQGRCLSVAQLYRLKKSDLVWNQELQYALATVAVTCANGLAGKIIFSKGYQEPEVDQRPGAKLSPKSSWAAFFTTDVTLTAAEVVKKFMSRWSIEVFFKEAKTMLGLGKDPGQSFPAQICAITLTFLRYNLLAFLKEQHTTRPSTGDLFHQLEQEIAPLTYMEKIVDYFHRFLLNILTVMQRFGYPSIDFETLSKLFINSINEIPLCQGCET